MLKSKSAPPAADQQMVPAMPAADSPAAGAAYKPKHAPRRKGGGWKFAKALLSTVLTLAFIALASLTAAHYFFPVMTLHTEGMSPAIRSGDTVVSLKGEDFSRGDVVAFQFGSKLLVKRIIAVGGDVINIGQNGKVTLNGAPLNEPYAETLALGECDLEMPYTVPADRVFVMGDQREVSLDSRSSAIGCVAREQIIGRVWLRIWPLSRIGLFN